MTLDISTEELAERFLKGETLDALAAEFGCHRNTIWYRLKIAGVKRHKWTRMGAVQLLEMHCGTMKTLLGPLRSSLASVRQAFADNAGDRTKRDAYLNKIRQLERQIRAVEELSGGY